MKLPPSHNLRSRRRSRRGFLLLDVVSGLLLIGVVAVLLGIATTKSARVTAKLERDRAATRLAELTALRFATSPTTMPTTMPAGVEVAPLELMNGDRRWVRVTAEVDGARATLLTLAAEGMR